MAKQVDSSTFIEWLKRLDIIEGLKRLDDWLWKITPLIVSIRDRVFDPRAGARVWRNGD